MKKCKSKKCKSKKCTEQSSDYNSEQQVLLDEQNKNLEKEIQILKRELDKTNDDLTRLMHAQNEQMDLLMEIVQSCLTIVLKRDEEEKKK